MKITKQQLKQIIKEELESTLDERNRFGQLSVEFTDDATPEQKERAIRRAPEVARLIAARFAIEENIGPVTLKEFMAQIRSGRAGLYFENYGIKSANEAISKYIEGHVVNGLRHTYQLANAQRMARSQGQEPSKFSPGLVYNFGPAVDRMGNKLGGVFVQRLVNPRDVLSNRRPAQFEFDITEFA